MQWALQFHVPPNDARLLSRTLKELIEDLYLARIMQAPASEQQVETDPSKPQLTGDPEWDAMELQQLDPAKDL